MPKVLSYGKYVGIAIAIICHHFPKWAHSAGPRFKKQLGVVATKVSFHHFVLTGGQYIELRAQVATPSLASF